MYCIRQRVGFECTVYSNKKVQIMVAITIKTESSAQGRRWNKYKKYIYSFAGAAAVGAPLCCCGVRGGGA
jgi:hypothetical protein